MKKYLNMGFLAVFILSGIAAVSFYKRPQAPDPSADILVAANPGVLQNVYEERSPASIESEEARINDRKREYIASGTPFVLADLGSMDMYLYDGSSTEPTQVKIKTKGKEGTWWETPSGEYNAIFKDPKHFSGLGHVWMPWSIQFYGNFFIHGWPYYENGTPVATTYSGGCIRLANEEAKTVYDFVKPGMPILIIGERASASTLTLASKSGSPVAPPELGASEALVANVETGEVFLNKNATATVPIASITKLMTAVVAGEVINMDRDITISEGMLSSPIQSYPLMAGQVYKIFYLFYPMLMQSSNGAAEAVSTYLGRNFFIDQMNKKAAALGMTGSAFVDPTGASRNNVSSAEDLMFLARYLFEKRKFILDLTKGRNDTAFGHSELANIPDFNDFYDDPELIGSKVGETQAAQHTEVLLWGFKKEGSSSTAPIVAVILGSPDRKKDAETLHAWIKDNFEVVERQ